MKVQIIYASLTGCTKKVAEAIYGALDTEKSIHDLKDGVPELDGDIILAGYWGMTGGPDEKTQEFLRSVHGKAVGIFCTLGYYADSDHARDTVKTGVKLVEKDNAVIGCYVCNGAVAANLKAGQGVEAGRTPTEQKELRWEMTDSHPTAAECALAAERFRERVQLYSRCLALNIPFTPIL